MSAIRTFVRREPVLLAAVFAALISCILIPPDADYLTYIDFRTLALLYGLMIVVSGLRRAGVFAHLAHTLCAHIGSVRSIGLILVLLCFFSAMLITNDVALLTFVPFAVVVLGMADRKRDLIHIVVLQTVAANLGSMLTPVGNPQNLYLYSYYDMRLGTFMLTVLPCWLVSLALLCAACCMLSGAHLQFSLGEEPGIEKGAVRIYAALFAVCLLVVLRVLPWPVMLAILAAVLLFYDRNMLLQADFMLLLTFVAFFIFSGNLARLPAVDALLRNLLSGREYPVSLLTSQVISNVPAALLLSGFTDKAGALLLGVNVGGLGTPIASLASLISMKLYAHAEHAHIGRYLAEFTAVNLLLILLLSLVAALI